MHRLSFFAFFLISVFTAYSQENLKCESFLHQEILQLDNEKIDFNSITISSDQSFKFDKETKQLTLEGDFSSDSLVVCYRVLPPQLFEPLSIRERSTYSQMRSNTFQETKRQQLQKPNIFEFNNVDMVGAISRGISIGNNQDLVVNSALNLQIDGKLTDKISIRANITDQNIPFQPEGNTQQVRDFDNVYMQLYGQNYAITAGDIVTTNTLDEGYFLQYYKNVQGIQGKVSYDIGEYWKGNTTGVLSISKGQFASIAIEPIEGVQGPYRLRGANNERFIIVMANSEKVYLDGILLSRGFDRDYTIDYNQSEIIFSNNVLITRFSRIRIDFEYADQFYGRSNLNFSQSVSSDKTHLYFNFYREQDNPNAPFGFEYSQENIALLSSAGDNSKNAFISGADSVGIIEDAILYQKKDTLAEGVRYEIFLHSPENERSVYQVSFTQVAVGDGDYILKNSTSNGKIYSWIAPEDGRSQGDYIAEIRVTTPNRKQMVVLGGKYDFNKYETAFTEMALSNQDVNLYSTIDDDDNSGLAMRSGLRTTNRPVFASYLLDAEFSYEYNHKNFQAIDRFRSIEYDRDWSYNSLIDSINRQDNIFVAKANLHNDKNEHILYEFNSREKESVVNGTKQQLSFYQNVGPFQLSSQSFLLHSTSESADVEWIRSSNEIKLNAWLLQPGYNYSIDKHRLSIGDSVISSLMNFESHNFFLKTTDTLNLTGRVDFTRRKDLIPTGGELEDYTDAQELKLSMETNKLKNHKLRLSLIHRDVTDKLLDQSDKNVLGLINWSNWFFERAISNNIQYSTANARELRRSFVYLIVPAGQGTHTWRDENNDGLQDINEFYEAVNIDERNYAKIFTPTDEYINAYQTTYVHTLDLKGPRSWRKSESDLLILLSKFSANAHVNINTKTTNSSVERLSPFKANAQDTSVIFLRSNRRYSLFYNRNAAGIAADFTVNNQDSKSLLSNGFELRQKDNYQFNIRWPIKTFLVIRGISQIGQIVNSSDFLNTRNYKVNVTSAGPQLVIQPSANLRFTTELKRSNKTTPEMENNAFSKTTSASLNVDWIQMGKGNLNVGFEWVSIEFEGEEQSALGYELLDALRPGSNQKWNVNWQQNIKSGLQFSLTYNGRKSQEISVIHTGSMSLTAFF